LPCRPVPPGRSVREEVAHGRSLFDTFDTDGELAGVHISWGYPRIWVKLRCEGWQVNRKRV
jgi:hypothetical protein